MSDEKWDPRPKSTYVRPKRSFGWHIGELLFGLVAAAGCLLVIVVIEALQSIRL